MVGQTPDGTVCSVLSFATDLCYQLDRNEPETNGVDLVWHRPNVYGIFPRILHREISLRRCYRRVFRGALQHCPVRWEDCYCHQRLLANFYTHLEDGFRIYLVIRSEKPPYGCTVISKSFVDMCNTSQLHQNILKPSAFIHFLSILSTVNNPWTTSQGLLRGGNFVRRQKLVRGALIHYFPLKSNFALHSTTTFHHLASHSSSVMPLANIVLANNRKPWKFSNLQGRRGIFLHKLKECN